MGGNPSIPGAEGATGRPASGAGAIPASGKGGKEFWFVCAPGRGGKAEPPVVSPGKGGRALAEAGVSPGKGGRLDCPKLGAATPFFFKATTRALWMIFKSGEMIKFSGNLLLMSLVIFLTMRFCEGARVNFWPLTSMKSKEEV